MNFKAVRASFKQQLFQFTADPQWIIPSIVAPFLFTAVMLMMYPEKSDTLVLQAILGGGVLGMWSNTLFASSFTLSYDRMNGTLDNILITPTDLFDIICGRSIWNTFIGLINMVLVYVFARLIFFAPLTIADPIGFVLALCITLLSLASIGLLFSLAFVFSRRSYILTSILEDPIYVISGAVVPITILPEWMQHISLFLAPSWGVEALRGFTIPGYELEFGYGLVGNTLVCLGLTAAYMIIAWFLMKRIVSIVMKTGSFTRY